MFHLEILHLGLPGDPLVETSAPSVRGTGSIPGEELGLGGRRVQTKQNETKLICTKYSLLHMWNIKKEIPY